MSYVIDNHELSETLFDRKRRNEIKYAYKEMHYSNIAFLLIDLDLFSRKAIDTYYNIFEMSIRSFARVNLRREYYDCLIARFANNERLNVQQIKQLEMRTRYANQEHILLKNAKNSFKKLITGTDSQNMNGDLSPFYKRVFIIAFLFEKKLQHIEHLKKITNNYKYNDSTKYQEGLSLLKELEYDYDKKIKKLQNSIQFLVKKR